MITSKPLRKDTVLSRQIGDEFMLFDSRNSTVHVINATAGLVWNICDGTNSIDDIKKIVYENYNISVDNDVERDIEDIINHFGELEVIDLK